jgi:hypothetical protein
MRRVMPVLALLQVLAGCSGDPDVPDMQDISPSDASADIAADIDRGPTGDTPSPLPEVWDDGADDGDAEEPSDLDGSPADGSDAEDEAQVEPAWQVLLRDVPEALLCVQGSGPDDVWVTGADQGRGALVLHWDGRAWRRIPVEGEGGLWWVHPLADGTALLAGELGRILRWDGDQLQRMETPGLARHTVFGVWARAADDAYAVGGVAGHAGFVWHWDGEVWSSLPLPRNMPKRWHGGTASLFKVWGDASRTWMVGNEGTVLVREGRGPLTVWGRVGEADLFTVHGQGAEVFAVGMGESGVVVALGSDGTVRPELDGAPLLQGVSVAADGRVWATGQAGTLWLRGLDGSWVEVEGPVPGIGSLHAAWVSEEGDLWAAGGNVLSPALDQGVLIRRALVPIEVPAVSPLAPQEPAAAVCPPEIVTRGAHRSVARRWIEQTLSAIRLSIPEPGVHARNLFHLSLLMWNVWAADDSEQPSIWLQRPASGARWTSGARDEAISYAAAALLRHRYGPTVAGPRTDACVRAVLEDLGFEGSGVPPAGSPGAIGLALARELIALGMEDGALEATAYQDPTWRSSVPVLVVDEPGTETDDPNTWQPLDLAVQVTQNGIALEDSVQPYIGPHWGDVRAFAVQRPAPGEPWFPLSPRPEMGADMRDWVVNLLQRAAELDVDDGVTLDISPAGWGNHPLGQTDGTGHPVNPVTGQPYEPNVVPRGDFARVVAEYWADGPSSETPPGHWNSIAHRVIDDPRLEPGFLGGRRWEDSLSWDVHFYLLLNAALHDAAIVSWDAKRRYLSARPLTLVRWMGQRGQSSDPDAGSWHPDGLPLVPGLIELITEETVADGERHAHLRPFVGEVAVWTWPGEPGDRENARSPHAWIRAADWGTYQRRTFVTPAFPGYTSGHSTFSHAAAEVMTAVTGSRFFPGGLQEGFVARANEYLEFERGPSVDVRLQWATYQDAAAQAGISRLWGGIHILPDDVDGRITGTQTGQAVVARFREIFGMDAP